MISKLLAIIITVLVVQQAPLAASTAPALPPLSAYLTAHPQRSALVADQGALREKPRAVVGFVSQEGWAFTEFLCMMHASWQHSVSLQQQQYQKPQQQKSAEKRSSKIDLVVFADHKWFSTIASMCTPLNPSGGKLLDLSKLQEDTSQCLVILYPPPDPHIWFGYPFINNVHYFGDTEVADYLTSAYGYIMKTDLDTFLSPAFVDHYPDVFETGVQEYVLLPSTSKRLCKVAADLSLTHVGAHNIGPAWYGPAKDVVALANLSIPIMHHIITKEFRQREGGGVADNWRAGEGWPEWCAGIAALYATEIAANHLFNEPEQLTGLLHGADMSAGSAGTGVGLSGSSADVGRRNRMRSTPRYDSHGDSTGPTSDVYHIHCRHGDKDFNKFDFFEHHYDSLNMRTLDLSVVKDYAGHLAVGTWRALQTMLRQRDARQEL